MADNNERISNIFSMIKNLDDQSIILIEAGVSFLEARLNMEKNEKDEALKVAR